LIGKISRPIPKTVIELSDISSCALRGRKQPVIRRKNNKKNNAMGKGENMLKKYPPAKRILP